MNAEIMLIYKQEEFLNGMQALNVTDINSLKVKLPDLRNNLKTASFFEKVYKFTFDFARNVEKQKNLRTSTAVSLWKLLITEDIYGLSKEWIDFLENCTGERKGIRKDEWMQFLKFMTDVKVENKKVMDYDVDGAWPVLIDEFYEYLNKI